MSTVRATQGTFTGAAGREIFWQSWSPQEARGIVLLIHGLAEHCGRYGYVAERLNHAGYAVHALDHHGHGRSGGVPGNISRMSHVVDDVATLRSMAEVAHPGLPVYVVGHSLGGLITLDYLLARGDSGLSGVVLSGAAVDPGVGSALEHKIAPLVSAVLPNLAITDLGSDQVSRDPEVVAAYNTDPLVYHGRIRARTGAEALAAVARVSAGIGKLSVPLLILHGEKDTLTTPKGSQIVHSGAGSADKTLTIYSGLFHEIFNEPERDAVIGDVVAWLDAH